jgi:outer membrane protein assembly factor BamE (lipoprotein component of BamABCDE complex)
MKALWRFIVFWRYLLLACLVLAISGFAYWLSWPHSATSFKPTSHQQPIFLWDKYSLIESKMTTTQVEEILGPPRSKERNLHLDVWVWVDDRRDYFAVFFLEDGRVMSKAFRRAGETSWKNAWDKSSRLTADPD